MAVVIPLVAAAFSASAGLAAVAAATGLAGMVAGYAMVAGAVLTGVGALTGKKDLMKAGSILSLAGGIGNIMAGSAAAAGSGAGAGAGTSAATAAGEAASAGTVESLYSASNLAGAGSLGDAATAAANAAGGASPLGSFYGSAAEAAGTAADAFGAGANLAPAANAWGAGITASPVQQAASGLTSSDVGGFLQRAASKVGDGLKEVGPWVRDNKELVRLGSDVIGGMYGPEAEANDMRREQMDYQKGLMDRAYRNVNSPVKLYNYARGG